MTQAQKIEACGELLGDQNVTGSEKHSCKRCKALKAHSEFYFKSKGRLDGICASCRKQERQERYNQTLQKKEFTPPAPATPESELLPSFPKSIPTGVKYTQADFHDLTEVFQILANIRDRVKRKAA